MQNQQISFATHESNKYVENCVGSLATKYHQIHKLQKKTVQQLQ